MSQDPTPEKDRDEGHSQTIPAMEWIVSFLGAILVSVMIATTLYQGVRSTGPYPELSVVIEHVEKTETAYLVVFKAQNTGDVTAADVTIEGQIIRDGLTIEMVSVTLNFVPAKSGAGGGMLFENDPNIFAMKLRVVSYTEP